MRYFVTVKTRAREDRIEAIDANHFVVSVKAVPIERKANRAVQRIVARTLGFPPSRLQLIAGATGKKKVFTYAEK